MGPFDYGSVLRSGQASVPDFASQLAQTQMLQLQGMQIAAAQQQAQREQDDERRFHADLAEVFRDPSPDAYSKLILRHPKRAEAVKKSWELLDDKRKQSDMRLLSGVYGSLANGKPELAAKLLRERIEADKASQGDSIDVLDEEEMLADIESGDPERVKQAQGFLGSIGTAIVGENWTKLHPGGDKPTAFMQNYEFIAGKDPDLARQYLRTEAEGRPLVGYDADGNPVLVPLGALPRVGGQQGGGGQASGGGGSPPASPSGPVLTGTEIETTALSAVPGLTVTSRARSPEKNRDVGGVPNSMHLTDQARDFVPPRGMSMNELAVKLRKAFPGADVINEGDHVHVESRARSGGGKPNVALIRKQAKDAIAAGADPEAVRQRAASLGVTL